MINKNHLLKKIIKESIKFNIYEHDPLFSVEDSQKLRGKIEVAINLDKQKVEELALQNENVLKHIDDKDIKKIIYVPNKLINVVV